MDVYDYNEDNLSMVASNCRQMSYKQLGKPSESASGISCRDCGSWTGAGCRRRQFDHIASELQLD